MWMGGFVPLGYDVNDRKLVVNDGEASIVRMIFERFTKIGSATTLVNALRAEGITGKRGNLVDKGYLYKLLNNRVYLGLAVHKGTSYPGEHKAIISQELWDKVHNILCDSPRRRAARTRAQTPALLKGLIFGPTGCARSNQRAPYRVSSRRTGQDCRRRQQNKKRGRRNRQLEQ
jgi:site-specific DNA recombinase